MLSSRFRAAEKMFVNMLATVKLTKAAIAEETTRRVLKEVDFMARRH